MAELKTKKNDESVEAYLSAIDAPQRQADCREIAALMAEATGAPPTMWGKSIVGFGSYHYRYASGREGDWFVAGFSNRKQSLTLYIMAGFSRYDELMARLGKHSTGKSCLYIKRLDDIDRDVLRTLINESVAYMNTKDHISG